MNESDFDLSVRLGELRSHSTEWLRARDDELECEQRRLKVEQLAVRRVLDERGANSVDVVARGTTVRENREAVEVSRALEDLPAIAAAAHAGELSWSQLKPLVEVATPETDREWAQRGQNVDPIDLARLARQQKVVTAEDAAARREARAFRWWWQQDTGMLAVRGELPDVDGALVKSVFEHLVERMHPPKGQPWDSLAHRGADALVAVCSSYADAVPTGRSRPQIVVQHPVDGPPEVDGIPIALETLDALRGEATFDDEFVAGGCRRVERPVRPGGLGKDPTHPRAARSALPDARLRTDPPSPEPSPRAEQLGRLRRTRQPRPGLPPPPRAPDPNGPYALIGDPTRVDGLRLVAREEARRRPRGSPRRTRALRLRADRRRRRRNRRGGRGATSCGGTRARRLRAPRR